MSAPDRAPPAATPKAATLQFARFEFKYVLGATAAAALEADLQPFVQLDPYVAGRGDRCYGVRSLYFDDPGHSAHFAKVDGMLSRAKFRLRTYGATATDPAPWFLERKGRHDNLVWKHRIPIDGPLDRTARGERLVAGLLQHGRPGPVREQFEYEVFRRRLQAQVLVDYTRRPYRCPLAPEFRLTFDRDLRSTPADQLFPGACATWHRLLPGYTVLEVKFRRGLPGWFHRLVQGHGLQRRSVSKVALATTALGLAPAVDP